MCRPAQGASAPFPTCAIFAVVRGQPVRGPPLFRLERLRQEAVLSHVEWGVISFSGWPSASESIERSRSACCTFVTASLDLVHCSSCRLPTTETISREMLGKPSGNEQRRKGASISASSAASQSRSCIVRRNSLQVNPCAARFRLSVVSGMPHRSQKRCFEIRPPPSAAHRVKKDR